MNDLHNVRCILINPYLNPSDLRGEMQHFDDDTTHECAINFGLLVIANSLVRHGASVKILDFEYCRFNWQQQLSDAINEISPQWVGIGNISVYSALPTAEILTYCRNTFPDIITVVGGQNAYNFYDMVKRLGVANELDYLICGDGEQAVLQLSKAIIDNQISLLPGINYVRTCSAITFAPRECFSSDNSFIDYSLYPNFRHNFPIVEESRGCPFSCNFCANSARGIHKYQTKDPHTLVAEILRIFEIYGCTTGEMPVVLMTSIFGVNAQATKIFFELLKAESITPKFLASTRVDLDFDSYIDLLPPYIDQMHFGLESASPSILIAMNKTTSPDKYLKKAEENFAKWHNLGMHTAINFILGYVGENRQTINESMAFFQRNIHLIDSAWGGGLIAYPDSPFINTPLYISSGATLYKLSPYCNILKTYPVNPSPNLSYDDIQVEVEKVQRLFYDPIRYYHHYKWYVGPRKDLPYPAFVSYEEFTRRNTGLGGTKQ